MSTELKKTIMERDCMTEVDADCLIMEAKRYFDFCIANHDFYAASLVCGDFFGLEPDYIVDLL